MFCDDTKVPCLFFRDRLGWKRQLTRYVSFKNILIRSDVTRRSCIVWFSQNGAAGMVSLYAFYVFSVIFVTYLGNISHFSSPQWEFYPYVKINSYPWFYSCLCLKFNYKNFSRTYYLCYVCSRLVKWFIRRIKQVLE